MTDELAERRARAKQGPAGSMVGGSVPPSDRRPDARERLRGKARLAEARAALEAADPGRVPEVGPPLPVVCEHREAYIGGARPAGVPETVPWCPTCESPLDDRPSCL